MCWINANIQSSVLVIKSPLSFQLKTIFSSHHLPRNLLRRPARPGLSRPWGVSFSTKVFNSQFIICWELKISFPDLTFGIHSCVISKGIPSTCQLYTHLPYNTMVLQRPNDVITTSTIKIAIHALTASQRRWFRHQTHIGCLERRWDWTLCW